MPSTFEFFGCAVEKIQMLTAYCWRIRTQPLSLLILFLLYQSKSDYIGHKSTQFIQECEPFNCALYLWNTVKKNIQKKTCTYPQVYLNHLQNFLKVKQWLGPIFVSWFNTFLPIFSCSFYGLASFFINRNNLVFWRNLKIVLSTVCWYAHLTFL